MKHVRVLLCVFALLAGLMAVAQAQVRTLPLSGAANELTLTGQEPTELRYRVAVGELAAMDVATTAGDFTRLFIPGFHSSHVEGAPELPMMNRLIEVPYGATARIEILSSVERSIDLAAEGISNPLFPAQPPMSKSADPASVPFVYDRAAYQTARVARELVTVVDQGSLRGVRIGRLEVSPVEYFPAENRIVVREAIEFRVIFENGDLVTGNYGKLVTWSPFFEPVLNMMDGYRTPHQDHPDRVGDVVTMVVITPAVYEAQLGPFVEWKQQRGFHMVVGVLGTPEVGNTKETVQAYIRNLYLNATPELPAPSFVIFVGDIDQMPTWTLSGDATDRPYCCIDADVVPDIYYGRFSAQNPSQLTAILDKTLMYDQFTMPDPSYLGEVVMIAGMDSGHGATWGNGQINYGTTYYFNQAHGIYSHTYLYPNSGSSAALIIQNVSDGVAYVNYTAHGSTTSWSDPYFSQSHVNGLQNYGEYCLAVGNCCLTSSYEISECFAETWLRAANKGAIGYIGGSNSTYWDEDYWWGVGAGPIVSNPTYETHGLGAYDGLFHDHGEPMENWYVVNDALIFCGNLAVMEGGSSMVTYYWNIYNLMGDPSISTYLGVPTTNPVNHMPAIFTGWTSVEIEAVPNSYVGLTKDGELIGAGTVPESGTLEIELWGPMLTPGTINVVVMAQNRVPYHGTIEVLPPSGPYLLYDSYVCDDDLLGASLGNGDGAADAGETLELKIMLRNVGVEPAVNTHATISTSDPYVQILDAEGTFGTIAAGASGLCFDTYLLRLAGTCPDGHDIPIQIVITADGRPTWEAGFVLPVDAPVLAVARAWVDDELGGNGNGTAEPGEQCDYHVILTNTGSEAAVNPTLTLASGDPLVAVLQATATAALIEPGQEVELLPACRLAIDGASPNPNEYPLWFTLTGDWGYHATTSLMLPVGGFSDAMEAGVGGWTHQAGTTGFIDQWHLSTERNHTPGGVYSWKQGDTGTGMYGNLCDGCLVTEAISLGEMTTLRCWHWMDAEVSTYYTGYCYDGGLVEVSINGGAWQQITPEEGYTHRIRTGATPGPFPAETQVYSGTFEWCEATFVLTGYAGSSGRFRFRFGSDGSSGREGWHIDDLVVSGSTPGMSATEWQPVTAHPATLLQQNSPNPFGPQTMIAFQLAAGQEINLQVFDATGRLLRTLANGHHAAGLHRVAWDGTDAAGHGAPSGVYYCRLRTGEGTFTRSLMLTR